MLQFIFGGGALLADFIRVALSHVFLFIAVPVFFVISGYLFFRNLVQWNFPIYIKKLKSRFCSLFIPYIIWNTIPLLYIIAGLFIKHYSIFQILDFINIKGGLCRYFFAPPILRMIYINWFGQPVMAGEPINGPLWFLRDLIILVILSPVIYWFVKRLGFYFLSILCFVYISTIIPYHSVTTSIFFFSIGAYFAISGKNIIREFNGAAVNSFLLALSFGFVDCFFDGKLTITGSVLYPFYIIFGVVAVFNLASWLIEKKNITINKTLAKSSFFIYCLHSLLVINICRWLVNLILPYNNTVFSILKYFLVPTLTVCVCLGIYLILKRFTPRLLNILTGNR